MTEFNCDKIRQYGFKRLLLAISGGLDSVCLAHYFICNKEALGIEWLGIAHVHHGLREETADRDATFVETFAKSYGIPFFLKKLDGEALKTAEGSLEENARDARYRALAEIALDPSTRLSRTEPVPDLFRDSGTQDDKKDAIVTAHHAGDQAETMYMRLRRGTTLAGLRGIQESRILLDPSTRLSQIEPVSDLFRDSGTQDDTSGINLFRPFLNVTRAKLLAYARENKLKWCEDESNSDVKFTRNKVRHEFLPKLEQECPGASEQLCRMAGIADRVYKKVVDTCEAVFGGTMLDRDCFGPCPRNDRSLDPSTPQCSAQDDTSLLSRLSSFVLLDKKQLRKVLVAHENADLSEMLRLWLSEKGFRFPIGFFYNPREPAHVKIPHQAAYRRRAIVKIGHTVQICKFSTPEEALNFVSCNMKDKGL